MAIIYLRCWEIWWDPVQRF